MIFIEDLQRVAKIKGIDNIGYAEKDYFLELILFILSNFPDIVFKGGTALRKFWNGNRFSEDLDFSGYLSIDTLSDLTKRLDNWGYPAQVREIREYGEGNYTAKIVIHGILYRSEDPRTVCSIRIDVNQKSTVIRLSELQRVVSLYPDIPSFSILVMTRTEILAEKVRALFYREKPQDMYDIYFLLATTPIDWYLIQEKLKYNNEIFSFKKIKKKIANMKRRWEIELVPLLSEVPNYNEVEKRVLEAFYNSNNND